MVTGRRFCSNCGHPVEPQDKFCGSCGGPLKVDSSPAVTPAQAASPTPPASQAPPVEPSQPAPAAVPVPTPVPQVSAPQPATPPSTGGEVVFGAISASRKTGMFSQEALHIVVTGRRLVMAAFTNEMVKQAAKEEGKSGFFSGMVGAMTVGYNYYKRYLDMPPEAALKENPQNFAIERSNIRKIQLQKGRRQTDRNRHVDVYEPSKLEIETTGQKYSFSVPTHFHEMASSVLRQAGLV